MKIIQKLIIMIFILIIIAYLSLNLLTPKSKPEEVKEVIYYAYVENRALDIDAVIAYEKGYFKEEGLNMQLLQIKSGSIINIDGKKKDVLEAIFFENIKIITFLNTERAFELELIKPGKMKILKMNNEDNENIVHSLVVRKDSNINSIRDLKGKTIGIQTRFNNPIMKTALKNMLESVGLTLNDVNIKILYYGTLEEKIKMGEIDASVTDLDVFESNFHGTTRTLVEKFLLTYFMNPVPTRVLIASSVFISDDPEGVQKFDRAFEKAVKFEKENQDEALRILKKYGIKKIESKVIEPSIEILEAYQDKLYENGIVVRKVDIKNMLT